MAAVAAVLSAATTAFSTFHITTPSSLKTLTRTHRHFRTIITASLPRSQTQFNITFAPPKPKPKPETESDPFPKDQFGQQLYIPWIVRDEKGNISLPETPPPRRLLEALVDEKSKTSPAKAKKKQKERVGARPLTSEPKFSKAARRFYNEKFRDPPQRLSKVLAASGG